MIKRTVVSADGTRLAAFEGGTPGKPAILFIHGFSQCSFCWDQQFADPGLAENFQLAAIDLRGHGASEKPLESGRYAHDQLFADDVHAVITVLGLIRPVLVGWSYAGRVISDYLNAHGTAGIAGINYVGARTKTDARFNGPGTQLFSEMTSDDLRLDIAATRKFLRACFVTQPPQDAFETMLAYNMLVPAKVRAAHIGRPPNDGANLARIQVPVLVTQGAEDLLVSKGLGEWTAQTIPGAKFSPYEGIGHTPFVEDAERFNRELAEFVSGVNS